MLLFRQPTINNKSASKKEEAVVSKHLQRYKGQIVVERIQGEVFLEKKNVAHQSLWELSKPEKHIKSRLKKTENRRNNCYAQNDLVKTHAITNCRLFILMIQIGKFVQNSL